MITAVDDQSHGESPCTLLAYMNHIIITRHMKTEDRRVKKTNIINVKELIFPVQYISSPAIERNIREGEIEKKSVCVCGNLS